VRCEASAKLKENCPSLRGLDTLKLLAESRLHRQLSDHLQCVCVCVGGGVAVFFIDINNMPPLHRNTTCFT